MPRPFDFDSFWLCNGRQFRREVTKLVAGLWQPVLELVRSNTGALGGWPIWPVEPEHEGTRERDCSAYPGNSSSPTEAAEELSEYCGTR